MKASLTPKDAISLLFSGLALLVSSLTMYLNLFRHVDDVQVRIANFEVENTLNREKDRVITHLAFINRGNQAALITGVESVMDTSKKLAHEPFGAPVDSVDCVFPFILEKGQMKLVEVTTPLSFLEGNTPQDATRMYFGLKIASINSSGVEQGAHFVFGEIELKNHKVFSFKSEHAMVSLFGREDVSFRMSMPCTSR
jgi:hypothetical protein